MRKIVLASASPRRRELLEMMKIPFEVMVSDADETVSCSEPAEVTMELAERKARAVAALSPGKVVLGADTVVAVDGMILGKPSDEEDAVRMMHLLQNRTHLVYTGVALLCVEGGQVRKTVFSEAAKVNVAPMTEEEISFYVSTGDGMDKAGGYGIQGVFSRHIRGIEGDYYNVVGLPAHRTYAALKEWWHCNYSWKQLL